MPLNAAHDLRNYFTVIQGRCDQALAGTKDPLWCAGEIVKLVKLCNETIDEMCIRLTGGAASTQKASRWGFDLNEIAGEAAGAILTIPMSKKIKIAVDLKLGLDPIRKGNAFELYRALYNLCMNACKAIFQEHDADDTGELRIRTGDGDDGKVWLTVSDNGCGMTPEQLHEILYKEPDPQKEHGRGMAIVRSTAKELGAELLCESEPGIGTTFTLLWKSDGGLPEKKAA
jgi:signal transduction histidine kinase